MSQKENAQRKPNPRWWEDGEPGTREQWRERAIQFEHSLREVYDYMGEVEGLLAGHAAVRSYLSLPRTDEERRRIGERARALLGRDSECLSEVSGKWPDRA